MNWLLILGPAGGVLAAILALTSCHPDPKIAAAKASADTATAQAGINTALPQIAQQSATKTLHIEVTAKEAAHAVQAAAGADTPVPPDVLARWRSGVERVRAKALAAHARPASGDDPTGLPETVPSP